MAACSTTFEAEDAYAPRGATLGSRFQSSSLGPSSMRKANKITDTINSLSSIFSVHYLIIIVTHIFVVRDNLLQFLTKRHETW